MKLVYTIFLYFNFASTNEMQLIKAKEEGLSHTHFFLLLEKAIDVIQFIRPNTFSVTYHKITNHSPIFQNLAYCFI